MANLRDPTQKIDIEQFGDALTTLTESNYADLANALARWGIGSPSEAKAFVEQQMGQLYGAVLMSPVLYRGRTLGHLPRDAQAAVQALREQICGSEGSFRIIANRNILKGKASESAVKAIWSGLKGSATGLFSSTLMMTAMFLPFPVMTPYALVGMLGTISAPGLILEQDYPNSWGL